MSNGLRLVLFALNVLATIYFARRWKLAHRKLDALAAVGNAAAVIVRIITWVR